MNLAALPDCKTRTAELGHFPWEQSGDAPELSKDDAVSAVAALLDGHESHAFGEDLDWWLDCLMDAICEPEDFRYLLLLGLRRGEGISATRHFSERLALHIHDLACGLLEKS